MSLVISVTGGEGSGVLEELRDELAARGADLEILLPGLQPWLGPESIPGAASMLARHGVIVLTRIPIDACPAGAIQVTEAELRTASSRQVFLRKLEMSGAVPAGPEGLSSEEQSIIRDRLQKLGYL